MRKLFWQSLLVSPAILGAALAMSSANAAESSVKTEALKPANASIELAQVQSQKQNQVLNQVENYSTEGNLNSSDQVTSVSELRDVAPTDWAYEALRSLVERYGCIVGYPDRTYRGNRSLSRWEFAAGLNACMNVMERLIQENVAVLREDIDKLKRLMAEFEAELAALGARVDNLEGRVSFLEDHSFSTTTKLAGEVIFAVSQAFGDGDNQAVFQDRVRLNLNTSFTGSDRLVTRLAAGNSQAFNTVVNNINGGSGTVNITSPTTNQTWQTNSGANNVSVDWLAYYTPINISKDFKLNTYVAAFGGLWDDFVPTLNPYFEDYDGGNGSVSSFSQRNPIYRIGGGSGAGVSLQLGFLESVVGPSSLSVGYLAGNAGSPNQGNGLFNGNYGILGQLNMAVGNAFNVGLTYVNAYNDENTPIFGSGTSFSNGLVGTASSNGVFSGQDPLTGVTGAGTLGRKVTNSYGVELAWKITDAINFSAFGSYTAARFLTGYNGANAFTGGSNNPFAGDSQIWTYGGGFAFPNLGGEGNVLGLFAGAQPYLGGYTALNTASALSNNQFSTKIPLTVEIFYKYQVTDNISITPAFIWISNPNQLQNAANQYIGTLRGTFTF